MSEPSQQSTEQPDEVFSKANGHGDRPLQLLSKALLDQTCSSDEDKSSENSEDEKLPDTVSCKGNEQGAGKLLRPLQLLSNTLRGKTSSSYEDKSSESSEDEEVVVKPDSRFKAAKIDSNKAVGFKPGSRFQTAKIDSNKITHSEQAAANCFPLNIVVTIKQEAVKSEAVKSEAEKRSPKKSYYDTRGKRGLLCIVQNDIREWKTGNRRDRSELLEFFKDKLNFDIVEYREYNQLVSDIKDEMKIHSDKYYCLLIFISDHGSEEGIQTTEGMKTDHEITNSLSNKNLKEWTGVPKIFMLDTCRGHKKDTSVQPSEKQHGRGKPSPTKTSDCLVIHATTRGRLAHIPNEGSVGLQGVMTVLKENWEDDHLEEMLIDARREVAKWRGDGARRQTLEIQTTLLKRLKFTRFC